MITILLNSGHLKIYNDIKQMPADNYKEFQKYQLMDGGIGSTMEDVDNRYSSLFNHISRGNLEDIRKEAENLYFNHYFVIKKISISHLSFGCLIHSVNDVPVIDFSEDNLQSVIKIASSLGLTQELLETQLSSTKKNSEPN